MQGNKIIWILPYFPHDKLKIILMGEGEVARDRFWPMCVPVLILDLVVKFGDSQFDIIGRDLFIYESGYLGEFLTIF